MTSPALRSLKGRKGAPTARAPGSGPRLSCALRLGPCTRARRDGGGAFWTCFAGPTGLARVSPPQRCFLRLRPRTPGVRHRAAPCAQGSGSRAGGEQRNTGWELSGLLASL